jgi:hypothetical protein
MNVLVGLVDLLHLSSPPLRWGSRGYAALSALLKRFHTFKSTLPTDDSLNLDPVVVRLHFSCVFHYSKSVLL